LNLDLINKQKGCSSSRDEKGGGMKQT